MEKHIGDHQHIPKLDIELSNITGELIYSTSGIEDSARAAAKLLLKAGITTCVCV